MKKLAGLVIAAIIVSFSTAVLAEGNGYAVLDIGQTSVPDFCVGIPSTMSCSTTATAYRVGGGVQINSGLGIEASYGYYGKINVGGTYLGWPVSGDGTLTGAQVAALVYIPVSADVDLMGKLGIGLLTAAQTASTAGFSVSESYNNTTLVFGLGARFKIKNDLAIRAQYENLGNIKSSSSGTTGTASLISVGLVIGL